MAAKKRTDVQRKADAKVLVEMIHQGLTYEDVQTFLYKTTGRKLSVRQLKYDMQAVRTRWAKQNMDELSKMHREELARLTAMEQLAWRKFYSCTGTRNKETIEQSVPMVKDEESGRMVPDYGVWEGKKKVVVHEDSTEDERFWWGQIMLVQEKRRQLLGLYKTRIEVNGTIGHEVKGYVGWTPASWDDPSAKPEVVDVIEGDYRKLTDGSD